MNNIILCDACSGLINKTFHVIHRCLVKKSSMRNFTIYRCSQCNTLLEHSEKLGTWEILPKPL